MRSFRDQQIAAVVLWMDGSEMDPAAVELAPDMIKVSSRCGSEVRKPDNRQWDAGAAAVVAVGFRFDGLARCCGHPAGNEVAGCHQADGFVVKL